MEEHNVKMLNPLSTDLEVMRQSLLFSGLESVLYNINRKNSSLKLFEFGKTYHKFTEQYEEIKHLSLFVSGDRTKPHWNAPQKSSDFFYLKGVISALLERLGISKTQIKPCKSDIFTEGISLYRGKVKLVDLGLVNSKILKEFGIKQEVFYADILWDNILDQIKNNKVKVKALPKFPEVKRDLSLLLDEEVKFSEIYNIAFQSEKKFLKAVDLFDFYQGDKLESGKKSYAVSFVLQDESQTLNDKQITKIMNKLQSSFEKQLGASLR
jgi:phenylalanyl-tRNA synthetase beta chain